MFDFWHPVADFIHAHSHNLLHDYGYIAILVVTFLEGESIVIVAGILAYQGRMDPTLIVLTAMAGSFLGDQFYFTLGQKFGTPLLKRFPGLEKRIEWAFIMVRKYETLFILSFRFIYGVRNVSPFVIAMSGVPRLRFVLLNIIAAGIWAIAFTSAGYFFGRAIKAWFGQYEYGTLGVVGGLIVLAGLINWMRKRHLKAQSKEKAETAALMKSTPPSPPSA